VKPLLQPRTQNKITLLGAKYMDELTKYVDIDNIPEYLGGRCRNTLLEDPGPWNDPQVLSMLGMISEENNEDAAEHLHMNEIDAVDSPAGAPVSGRVQAQSPHTPEVSPCLLQPVRRHHHCVLQHVLAICGWSGCTRWRPSLPVPTASVLCSIGCCPCARPGSQQARRDPNLRKWTSVCRLCLHQD
jgi:hypothetical protein